MTQPNDLCPEKSGTDATHCWHDTGVAYLSYPPQIEKCCCHCGTRKLVRPSGFIDHAEHGMFLSRLYSK